MTEEIQMEKMQTMLSKTEIIKLRLDALQTEMQFNIFRILREGHEEVGLHSRFLYELLNPAGSHGMNDIFLRLFAEECQLPTLSYDSVRVLREHANIDILIHDNHQAVVIENKIYAGDQPEQLKRYYEYVKSNYRQPTLFYLTLHGDEPAPHSAGDLAVILISYKNQISRWLTACIKEAVLKPVLRETLIQYQTLINQLTGNTMSEFEEQQVLSLVAQGENAEQALIIQRNWNHVRRHTEWDFWTELSASAATKFKDIKSTFTADALDKLVYGGHNKDYDIGIEFPIGKLDGNDVIFKIERGDVPVNYGLPYASSEETVKKRMREAIQHLGTASSESWAGFKDTKSGIDFYSFENAVTLQLANPTKRQAIVADLWQEIQLFVRDATASLQQEFKADFVPAGTSTASK